MKEIAGGLAIYVAFALGAGALLLGIAHGSWLLAVGGLIACVVLSVLLPKR